MNQHKMPPNPQDLGNGDDVSLRFLHEIRCAACRRHTFAKSSRVNVANNRRLAVINKGEIQRQPKVIKGSVEPSGGWAEYDWDIWVDESPCPKLTRAHSMMTA